MKKLTKKIFTSRGMTDELNEGDIITCKFYYSDLEYKHGFQHGTPGNSFFSVEKGFKFRVGGNEIRRTGGKMFRINDDGTVSAYKKGSFFDSGAVGEIFCIIQS
jgi:hypothetical protein